MSKLVKFYLKNKFFFGLRKNVVNKILNERMVGCYFMFIFFVVFFCKEICLVVKVCFIFFLNLLFCSEYNYGFILDEENVISLIYSYIECICCFK